MSWRDAKWKYISAAESAKPGYLAGRFAEIRREIEAKKKAGAEKVSPIKRTRREPA